MNILKNKGEIAINSKEQFFTTTDKSEISDETYELCTKILTDYNDLLSVEDLAKIFQVSKQTIRKEIKAGKFGAPIFIGRAFKVPKLYVISRFFAL